MLPNSRELEDRDAMSSLLGLARNLLHADLVMVVECLANGTMKQHQSLPPLPDSRRSTPFRLHRSEDAVNGWSALDVTQLPSLLAAGLPVRPVHGWALACARRASSVQGALLFFWETEVCPFNRQQASDHPAHYLRTILATLLEDRLVENDTARSDAQFDEIFNSVSQGMVVVHGRGATAQINAHAALLLGVPPGSTTASRLAEVTRRLRNRCENQLELQSAYAAMTTNPLVEVVCDWHLGSRIFRVQTRPLLSHEHSGRIWIFEDVSAQIHLERLLRQEASEDPLTGLMNRRSWFGQVSSLCSVPPEHGAQAAIVLFDLDHFKQVNDQHGHQAGDLVLQAMAKRASAVLRQGDLLARYGGEEFVIFIRPMNVKDVGLVTERLRAAVEEAAVQLQDAQISCTISIGVALHSHVEDTLEQLIRRADQNLYMAKRAGRNCVVMDGDGSSVAE